MPPAQKTAESVIRTGRPAGDRTSSLRALHSRVGKSPLTGSAYLIWIENTAASDAVEPILKTRSGAAPAWEALHNAGPDMGNRFRHEMEKRAYELFQAGVCRDALTDWVQARAAIVKAALTGGAVPCRRSIDIRIVEKK